MKKRLFFSAALACLVAFTFTGCKKSKKSPDMPIVTEIENNGDGTYTLYDDYRLCKGSVSNFKTTSQKKQIETWNKCERCGQYWVDHDTNDSYSKTEYEKRSYPEPTETAPAPAPKQTSVKCPACNGTRACKTCQGLGAVSPYGYECEACNGLGTCPKCSYGKTFEQLLHEAGVNPGTSSPRSSSASNSGSVTCGRCNGTGYYHWSGTPRYSGDNEPQWTNCLNCGQVFDGHNSHTCSCVACNGTGRI